MHNINSLNSYTDFHDRNTVQTRLSFHPCSRKDHQKAFGGQWNHLQQQGKLIQIWVLVGFFFFIGSLTKNTQNCKTHFFVETNTCVGFINIFTTPGFHSSIGFQSYRKLVVTWYRGPLIYSSSQLIKQNEWQQRNEKEFCIAYP